MAEREQDLGQNSDNNPSRLLFGDNPLLLAARQDFGIALDIAGALKHFQNQVI